MKCKNCDHDADWASNDMGLCRECGQAGAYRLLLALREISIEDGTDLGCDYCPHPVTPAQAQ